MSLIPGTLPSGACYGTPQELLDLFAQYLDIPAFAVSSKVIYSATSPMPNTDFVWVDTTGSTTPVFKLYNEIIGDYEEYPFQGQLSPAGAETLISGKTAITTLASSDLFLVSQAGTSAVLKKITFANLIGQIPSGSITYPMLNNSATEANNVAKRTIKAWVSFAGGTQTAYSTQSFNVSSIARVGATSGYFRVSFTTAMSANNYAVLGTVGTGGEVWNNVAAASVRIKDIQTTYTDIITVAQNSNAVDFGYTSIAILSS